MVLECQVEQNVILVTGVIAIHMVLLKVVCLQISVLVNLLLLPIPIVFLGAASIFGFVASISYRIMVWYYITLIVLEILVITFLTPAITAGCISLEKERQTLARVCLFLSRLLVYLAMYFLPDWM